ncbi:MAG: ATP-binding cassette domain-containing protein [Acidobacteria bacterium]|nr:ATP-binding cassette domain-containing protein [Acidobacteriota bacterium]
MPVIDARDVYKTYEGSGVPVHAVNGISFAVEKGEFTAVIGPSGCGKTTLLNMVGGLDSITKGEIYIGGTQIDSMSEAELTDFRLKRIGFVFQAYNLIPVLTAKENIEFIMELQGIPADERAVRSRELLAEVGIADQADKRPGLMSGGQQQRVAVARALASKPEFVLADEPTANLDSHATSDLLDLMAEMNANSGVTFVFATHDQRVIDRARRVIALDDGKIVSDTNAG